MVPVGIRFYGLGAIALGVVGIVWGDFALQWQPVAAWFPARTLLAYLFAAALIVAGACVNDTRAACVNDTRAACVNDTRAACVNDTRAACVNDTRGRGGTVFGATALAVLYAGVVIFMHGPLIIQHPASFANWSGAAEQATLLAGGLASYAWLTRKPGPGNAAVTLMGVCLVIFGIAHFLYLEFTASMVPAWLQGGQKLWAAATGIGHIAAGVAFLTGVRARLAAVCVTAMFGSFSILVHLPLILTDPRMHMNWVMNAINLALTGAAWAVATYLTSAQKTPAAISAAAGVKMTQ